MNLYWEKTILESKMEKNTILVYQMGSNMARMSPKWWTFVPSAVHSIHSNSDEIYECFASTAQLLRPKKRTKTEHLVSSITLGYSASRDGSRNVKHWKGMKILFDSGCAATLVNHELVKILSKLEKTKLSGKLKLEYSPLVINVI